LRLGRCETPELKGLSESWPVLICIKTWGDANQHHFCFSPVYGGLHQDGWVVVRICTGTCLGALGRSGIRKYDKVFNFSWICRIVLFGTGHALGHDKWLTIGPKPYCYNNIQ
jgi:hypothetical protein